MCAFLFGFWRSGKKKNSLMGTNFQFNVVSKWKKYHGLQLLQEHMSPTNRLFCRRVSFFSNTLGGLFGAELEVLQRVLWGRGGLGAGSEAPPQWVCLLGQFAPRCPCLTSPAIETCRSSWHCEEAVIVPLCVLVPSCRAYRVTAVRLRFGSQSLVFWITLHYTFIEHVFSSLKVPRKQR